MLALQQAFENSRSVMVGISSVDAPLRAHRPGIAGPREGDSRAPPGFRPERIG
jgi:hypothetical protein